MSAHNRGAAFIEPGHSAELSRQGSQIGLLLDQRVAVFSLCGAKQFRQLGCAKDANYSSSRSP